MNAQPREPPPRSSKLGYRTLGSLADQATLAAPSLDCSLDQLFSTFEGLLISQGRYPDEAHAMLETWKTSWFDDSCRILYIVPRRFVDSVLPLSISTLPPAPASSPTSPARTSPITPNLNLSEPARPATRDILEEGFSLCPSELEKRGWSSGFHKLDPSPRHP